MKIYEVPERSPLLLHRLVAVWEESVRATHLFLSDDEIKRIKDYVPVAFMGVEGDRLEMLFLSPAVRGMGLGRQLLERGIHHYGVRTVTVNEQNPQAVGFYEHMGFRTYQRTDHDEQGNPYPLLYMERV